MQIIFNSKFGVFPSFLTWHPKFGVFLRFSASLGFKLNKTFILDYRNKKKHSSYRSIFVPRELPAPGHREEMPREFE